MPKTDIQYSYAFDSINKKLVFIQDVDLSRKSFLICKDCNQPFIVVTNHRTPHFKHKSDSKCSGTKETYIHWVSKELFKNIKKIFLPKLLIDDLPELERQKFQEEYNQIIDNNIPQELRKEFKKDLKKILIEEKEFEIKNVEIEKEFKSNLGCIKVDVVLSDENEKIFIEPFYLNDLKSEKIEKIELIDITTFSIDLKKFLEKHVLDLVHNSLKNYLVSSENKKWEYINNKVFTDYLNNYKNYLENEIIRFKPYLEYYNNLTKEIGINDGKIKKLNKKIKKLEKKKIKIRNENFKWQNEIDNIFDNYKLI